MTAGLTAVVLAGVTAGLVAADAAAGAAPATPAAGLFGGAGGGTRGEPVTAAVARAATLPAAVHCGTLQRVERVTGSVPWIDLQRVLADGNLDAGTGSADAARQRPPADGMCFAVMTFSLARGRTLSKYDYRVDAGGKAYECLGVATGDGPFDARRWKVETDGEARLLFEVPAAQATLHLVPALTTAIPMRAVRGVPFAAAAAAAAAPTGPVPEPAKPAAEPAKPAAEPAKPAAEPAKPAAEPAKPAAKRDALEF